MASMFFRAAKAGPVCSLVASSAAGASAATAPARPLERLWAGKEGMTAGHSISASAQSCGARAPGCKA